VGVFNYLEVPLAVVVELADAPADYDVVSGGGRSTTVHVAAKGTGSVGLYELNTRKRLVFNP
jgi:hypothetical protein